MEKKRYILFAYFTYYPAGGMNDSKFSFDTKEELLHESSEMTGYDYYEVFDAETFIVGEGSSELEAYLDTVRN